MKPVARWLALAALTLTLTMAAPSGAHAEVVADSNVNQAGTATAAAPRVATAAAAAAVTVVYPRAGEGFISLTTRTCGTSATWRQQATANRVYGPAFVIYLGRGYTITCTRAATTATRSTATRSVTRGWVHPVPGTYRCGGYRTAARPNHNGVDLMARYGLPIRAAAAGTVKIVHRNTGNAGYYIVLDHGTINTVYMHMRALSFLPVGRRVAAGQTIGYVGQTGNATVPHVHFEVQLDPMWSWDSYRNPAPFMRARGVNVGC